MFNEVYSDWNHKRSKAIIDHYGYTFFHGKKILDLGAGHGDIAAALVRLGADVLCVDARQDNLDVIAKKHPFLRTMKLDLNHEWPFATNQFDIVLSLGLLCHLKNYEQHIYQICSAAEIIVLETEVLDSTNTYVRIPIFEEKVIHDLSFHGEGSIVSAANIQNRFSEYGATFKRKDDPKLNSGPYVYNWRETDSGRKHGNRRFWFIRRDKHFAKMQENNQHAQKIEKQVIIDNPKPIHPLLLAKPEEPINRNRIKDKTAYVFRPSAGRGNQKPPPAPAAMASPNTTKIRLFYNYYEDINPMKKMKIDLCLQKNVENTLLDIVILQSDVIPTFDFYFEKINKITGPDDINIICNSDIFLDGTISFSGNIKEKEVYALSSWNWDNGPKSLQNYQSVWIVRGNIQNVNGNILVDAPFADSIIAYEFDKAGYKVSNPSKSIRTYRYSNANNIERAQNKEKPESILLVESTAL